MTSYCVVLKVAGPLCIEADTYHWTGDEVQFYRGAELFARYPALLVEEVTETGGPPGMTSFFTAEGLED